MEICKRLHDSAASIQAIVRVDTGETADLDEMARMLDGEIGHFGYTACLIKVGDPEPAYHEAFRSGRPDGFSVEQQSGFPRKPGQADVRYYLAQVYRD